ncbi:cellulose binding domain-containing protein, partial [Streptomyces sp. SAS_269]|uniref:cellulose binding domain-containing protein n=1 Tax=Streptomyces sp. SAS_269 TaxID=3412749 RepID=UPI00403C772C
SCTVAYHVTNQWPGGFQADVTLTDTGTSPWNGWSLTWSFADGQRIGRLWNADWTQSGPSVTAKNVSWNGTVAADSSVSFGFTGDWSGTNTRPASFKLGDQSCTVT